MRASTLNRLISVAPMMDCTDKHDRYFLRLIAPHILLYTEMLTTAALIHGDYKRLLAFDSREHPVALQLGGSQPKALKDCAKMGEDFGYDEINLNVGCPSDRVQSGRFGACLMLEPQVVAEGVATMINAVQIPVTVKCRIGVDERDTYEHLQQFIETISTTGCKIFIIHARKAWLSGLSPKENREIPPLLYDVVYQIKKDFPELTVIINGGIKTIEHTVKHLQHVDGVMIGREAYANPYFLAQLEEKYFHTYPPSRHEVVEAFLPYIERQLKDKVKLSSMTRHMLGLFLGEKGARLWRRYLSENAHLDGAGLQVIRQAIENMKKI